MITLFETYNKKPKIGNWIIDKYGNYGEIVDILDWYKNDWVSVKDKDGDGFNFWYDIDLKYKVQYDEIEEFGTKEEMLIKIQTNKYNI